MLQFDITLKCGQPSVKRLTWLKNTGLTILRGTTELDAGEVTTCDAPTIINMRGARIVVDANTRVYCPISPSQGGDVYYCFTPTWTDSGYVLALNRATE